MAKNKVKKGNKSKGAKKPSIPPKALPVTLLSGFLVGLLDVWLGNYC
jgi:hypothetical protein